MGGEGAEQRAMGPAQCSRANADTPLDPLIYYPCPLCVIPQWLLKPLAQLAFRTPEQVRSPVDGWRPAEGRGEDCEGFPDEQWVDAR